jgi:hypothetical protein
MANAPPVSSGTRERQSDDSSELANDIEEAVEDFMAALDSIALKHGQ